MDFSSGGVTLALVDLAQVSTTSHKGTLGLLPVGRNGRQKFVVGDDSGTVHCFEMKRGEAQSVFSFRFADGAGTSHSGTAGTGTMVTAVVIGGSTGGPGGGDRVFVTQGSSIVGLSRKGKEFFKMASPLSETIHHMAVQGARIWTGCDYICSAYDDGQDTAFYMCHDRIASLTTASFSGTDAVDAVLGCQDHCVRVIKASESEVAFQASTDAPVGALCAFSKSGTGIDQDTEGVVYGTDNGTLGHLSVAVSASGPSLLRKTWELLDDGGERVGRGVTALARYDLTQDGAFELIAGREDGTVTVYRFSDGAPERTSPQEAFSTNLGESIRSLEGGRVSSDEHPEIVACTFRGRICSLTTQALDQGEAGDALGRTVGGVNTENRVKQLRKEVEDLEKRVAHEKKQLEHAARGGNGNESSATAAFTPATQHFQAITSCNLDHEQGAYVISVETPVPLDLVLLHSAVHIDFLESDEENEVGQATSCVTSLSPENGGGMCATYRFEGGATRLRVRARTTEGDYGDVRLTVVAKIPPKKSAQVINFSMKPLSLHRRIHKVNPNMHARPMNALVLRGSFTMQVVHDWLAMCLPEVPPRISEEAEDATLNFENVFTGGLLTVSYRRGAAVLSSDSASTLAIVKELISKEATSRRVHITDSFQGEPNSVPAFLKMLDPKLTKQFALAHQVELMGALKEVSMQETETPWMFDEYRYILDNADQIKKEFKGRPRALEYISGIITDLYVDWHKFKGDDARHRIPELENLLAHYNYKKLVAFFLKRP